MTRLVSHLCRRLGRCPFQAQLIGNRLLDNGTLEEACIVARVQHCGIGERELAKILFGDEALLNHLKRFGYDIRKVGDVKAFVPPGCQIFTFDPGANWHDSRTAPTAALSEPTEAKPQISQIAPTIDTCSASAIYLL